MRKRLPPDIQALIAERREAGAELKAIADEFNCTQGSVQWACLKLGAELPNPCRLNPLQYLQNPIVMRGNHVVRAFTPQDDEQIRDMEARGLNNSEIGRRLTPVRKPNSIKSRLMTLARRDERAMAG